MKTRILFIIMLAAFCVSPAPAQAASGERSWTQCMTNEDGSPLTDLAGWRAYCSSTPNIDPFNAATYNSIVPIPVGTTNDAGVDPDNGCPRHSKVIDCAGIEEPYMVLTSIDDKSPANQSGPSNEIYCADKSAPPTPGVFSCNKNKQ